MEFVYIVQHAYSGPNDTPEQIRLIGVYSTEDNARRAITRISSAPGFKDNLDGFHVERYRVGKDHWAEGYVTMRLSV